MDEVLESKKLKVGTLGNIKPWSYFDASNQLAGFDIDMIKMIAKDLGAEVEFVVLADPPARISSLLSGQVHIVANNFTLTAERAKSVAFSLPYAPDPAVLVGRKRDAAVKSYSDIPARMKCGIVTGTTQEILATLAPQAEIIRFRDTPAQQAAIESGQIDCFVSGDFFADEIVAKNRDLEKKGIVYNGYTSFGVPRNDVEWLNWINQAIIFHGGRKDIEALYVKHMGKAMPKVLPDF